MKKLKLAGVGEFFKGKQCIINAFKTKIFPIKNTGVYHYDVCMLICKYK